VLSFVISRLGALLLLGYAALVAIGPAIFEPSWLSLLYLTLYFICLAGAWNLFSGFSGYINFGFVAFIGVGMYAAVIAIVDLKFAPLPAYLIGGGIGIVRGGARISDPENSRRIFLNRHAGDR
jgi:ABC-type branched-subunit amino acid transport system permease subunit